jgi:hypothetical protein
MKKKELLQQNKGKKRRLGDDKILEPHRHCWHESKLAKPSSSLASLMGFNASRALGFDTNPNMPHALFIFF